MKIAARTTSARLKELQRHFGFGPDKVAAAAKSLLGRD
jgi:hypothetical protein